MVTHGDQFNIRDTGINVDFLSFSALHLADQDKRALSTQAL